MPLNDSSIHSINQITNININAVGKMQIIRKIKLIDRNLSDDEQTIVEKDKRNNNNKGTSDLIEFFIDLWLLNSFDCVESNVHR